MKKNTIRKSRVVQEAFEDTIDKVRIDLSSGKINKVEASRRLNAINKAVLDDAEGYDPELMDEGMEEDNIQFEDVVLPEEIGDVEVEKVLAPEEELPIKHADEPVEMLDVFSVYNDDLSDKEFYAVVDVMDNDADTGITFVQLTESGEVDHEATNKLVQNVVDKLEADGYEVVNLNAAGVDAEGTKGDEVVAAELELGEAEDKLDEPVEGGFQVVGNLDGSVSILGDPEVLLPATFGDAADDVVAELSEMPYVSGETEQVLESRKKGIKESMRKIVEASDEEYASAIAEYLDVPEDEVEVRTRNDYSVYYAEVEAEGQEFLVFDNYEEAERFARGRIEDYLESEPTLFSPDFIRQHLYMTIIDKQLSAREEADFWVDSYTSDDDILEYVGLDSEYEDADDEDKEAILERAKEEARDKYEDEMIDKYDDVFGYFSDELGYGIEDILNIPTVHIDYNEAARDAVIADGVAHFLATYDGDEIELPNGMYAYRTN